MLEQYGLAEKSSEIINFYLLGKGKSLDIEDIEDDIEARLNESNQTTIASLAAQECNLNILNNFFIGPESDHWECLSLTHSLTNSLTHSCLVNFIDVTLTCEDANSKLVEVVTVADVDAEDHVGNSLLIWEPRLGIKLIFC